MHYSDSFKFASDFINYTNTSIFLTGKAGTGKTTFLKHCKENAVKNTAIVAPTGVAAMNAGGTTIHSFFQLPFTPYLPLGKAFEGNEQVNDKNSLLSRLRLNNERRDVMQKLELLIVDEISMVRCDVLDAMDTVLRHIRSQYSRPFGGVQVLLIGDMYQLPPVVKEEEWQILSPRYKSPYFFNSHVIEQQPLVYVELDKIYRQNDASFVNLLNQVRNNAMDDEGFKLLHSRYLPSFTPPREENYITLTTHNNKADAINFTALNELQGKLRNFNASIEGEFYEKSYPADLLLKLKVGAQVMFIKNDTEKIRRYFNGKIGIVEKIEDEKIQVLCNGVAAAIEVKKEKWKNIRYVVDKTTNQVEENEIGSFTQFPLRLAWAITIHKSQGLTFEKAVIDAGEAFAPGQVYVALSRCTSLQGMILHSSINNNSLHSDSRITSFAKTQKTSAAQLQILHESKKQFQQEEIKKLFDFSEQQLNAKAVWSFVAAQQTSFNTEALLATQGIHTALTNIETVAKKFETQLNQILAQQELPENNETVQERLVAAARHFSTELEKVKNEINTCPAEADSKLIATDFNKLLLDLYFGVCLRLYLLNGCESGFKVDDYLQHKRSFLKPILSANAYAGKSKQAKTDSPHPELYKQLRKKRDTLCEEKNMPVYLIAGSITLEEMALYLPQTIEELKQINGFGPVKTQQFGEIFLTIIREYCAQHDLQTNMGAKPAKEKHKDRKAEIKTDTKVSSFTLFKEGKTMEEIAIERNMTVGTIEGHLSYFVGIGEIDVNTIISQEKLELIKSAIEKFGSSSNKILKENLPENITYGEIRMVMASIKAVV
ncbi:MAG: helix-turn-helix domain-containing protein [Ferruginibacter sp.]|nr:helix-turn-helix domain-containing protein [Ferruginibacter sp.]